jgi:hypothetical protein
MALTREPTITKLVDDTGSAHFTVCWSALQKVDKYEIIKCVPAVAGLFELYFQDEYKKLIRFYIAKVWIGSLRTRIRRLTDPTLLEDAKWRDVLEHRECFFRYSVCHSYKDLTDVLYFFSETIYPHEHKTENSKRYTDIAVYEKSPDKIVNI